MNDEQEHNALLDSANTSDEGTPLGVLADWLEERGRPGANLARAGMKSRKYGFQGIFNHESITGIRFHDPRIGFIHRVHEGNTNYETPNNIGIEVVHREGPVIEPRTPMYLAVTHRGSISPEGYTGIAQYRVPVTSRSHLEHLISDLPEDLKQKVRTMSEEIDLPNDSPEQLSRNKLLVRRYGLFNLNRNPEQIKQNKVKRYINANRGPIEHAAIHRALHEAGLLPDKIKGETEKHYQGRVSVIANDKHKQVHNFIKKNPEDKLVNYYNQVNSNLHNPAWTPQLDTGLNSARTGAVDERLMHGYLPIVRYLAAQKGHSKAPTNFLNNPHLKPMSEANIEEKNKDKYDVVDLNDEDHYDNSSLPFATDFEVTPHPYSIEGLGGIRPEEKKFEYRLPSGFVSIPKDDSPPLEQPKPKRVIKNPRLPTNKRNSVYQTIAHALANRENVHEILNKEYGFDRPTATRHYNNYLKNKNKPEGKIRPENRIPIPRKGGTGRGNIRTKKSRYDPTDLMTIPIRYGLPKKRKIKKPKSKIIEPIKNAQYHAPKGGVIVRGTQYTGGQIVPNMQGSFMNPKRKLFAKLYNLTIDKEFS